MNDPYFSHPILYEKSSQILKYYRLSVFKLQPPGNLAFPHFQSRFMSALLYIICGRFTAMLTDNFRIDMNVLHSAWSSPYTDPLFSKFLSYFIIDILGPVIAQSIQWPKRGWRCLSLSPGTVKISVTLSVVTQTPFEWVPRTAGEQGRSVVIATNCGLDGPVGEGVRFSAPLQTGTASYTTPYTVPLALNHYVP